MFRPDERRYLGVFALQVLVSLPCFAACIVSFLASLMDPIADVHLQRRLRSMSLYTPSGSSSTTSLMANYPVYEPLPVYVVPDKPRRNIYSRRFRQLATCVFLLVAALFLLSGSESTQPGLRLVETLYPSQIQCDANVNWTTTDGNGDRDYSYYARTRFSLPIYEANELEFIAEGALSQGVFSVSRSLEPASTEAILDLDVAYRHPEALSDATVCRTHALDKEENAKWGLGISTSRWAPESYRTERLLHFHAHLRLPSAVPLRISKFTTDLPRFEHRMPDLASSSVFFDTIRLKTANALINAGSMAGHIMKFKSSNGAIRGTFWTPRLELETSNAPIDVRATLTANSANGTRLVMKTSNARIDGIVTLLSSADHTHTPSSFHLTAAGTRLHRVSSSTSNGQVNLAFTEAESKELQANRDRNGAHSRRLRNALAAAVWTSNAPARVILPKTFEGAFNLASSGPFRPMFETERTVRVDAVSSMGTTVSGSVLSEFESALEPESDSEGLFYYEVDGEIQHPENSLGDGDGGTGASQSSHVLVRTVNAPLTVVL